MNKWFVAFFRQNGAPKTGLTPIVHVRDLADNSFVLSENMSEVGEGFYKYLFTTYDETKSYAIRYDGGATLGDLDRYIPVVNESYIDDIDAKLVPMESNIRGTDSDDLKVISDQVDVIQEKLPNGEIAGSIDKTSLESKHGIGSWGTADVSGIALESSVQSVITKLAEHEELLIRIVGMTQENFCIDDQTYEYGRLISARVRIYSNAGSVGSDSDVIATYTMLATYTSGQLTSYKVVKN